MCKRYEWEDALVKAQVGGVISDGALLVALKLATAINWNPSTGKTAGLYWKNEEAFKAVGISRATYFRHRQSLFETGFLSLVGGNLIPDTPESLNLRLEKSQSETKQSQLETTESQLDNPLSVDTLSEDTLTVDHEVLDAAEAAGGSDDSPLLELDVDASPLHSVEDVALDTDSGEFRKSQVETMILEEEEWDLAPTVQEKKALESPVPNEGSTDTTPNTEAVTEASDARLEALLQTYCDLWEQDGKGYDSERIKEIARAKHAAGRKATDGLVIAAKDDYLSEKMSDDEW